MSECESVYEGLSSSNASASFLCAGPEEADPAADNLLLAKEPRRDDDEALPRCYVRMSSVRSKK